MDNDQDNCPNPDDPEFVALWDQYETLRKKNARKEMELSTKYGPSATLPQVEMIEQRLQRILEIVLPRTTTDRIQFEMEWQSMIARSLEVLHNAIQRSIREAKESQSKKPLTLPNQGGLIIPGGGKL